MAAPFELHREVKRGNIERVRRLLREGADINATAPSGQTPLMYALESPAASVALVSLLLDRGAAVPKGTVVSACLQAGDPAKLTAVLARGEDPHHANKHRYNAAIDAILAPNSARDPRLLDVLKILIANGVELNIAGRYDRSALQVASRIGRFDAVRLLLDAGADEAPLAWTSLHRAVALGALDDVKAALEGGEALETRDSCDRTPWLLAVATGDVEQARYLIDCGADFTVSGRGGESPLIAAIESFHTPMLKWLIGLGVSVDPEECSITPLMTAVEARNIDAVDALIAAGADLDRRTEYGIAIESAGSREIALRLLAAGADPAKVSFEARRAIVYLDPQADALLFDGTPEDFRAAPRFRCGASNPELVNEQFWQAMVRSGISAYAAGQMIGALRDDSPTWCAQRFGQSFTLLPDGRAIQVGGEHEDSYDADFCIYNDVFVHYPDGKVDIFCYPEEVFPPTDFHTATLLDDSIYIIGSLGYQGSRRFGETPLYRLDTTTLRIDRIETTGAAPGWISRHRASRTGAGEIRVWHGTIAKKFGDGETYAASDGVYLLDVARRHWRREQ